MRSRPRDALMVRWRVDLEQLLVSASMTMDLCLRGSYGSVPPEYSLPQ